MTARSGSCGVRRIRRLLAACGLALALSLWIGVAHAEEPISNPELGLMLRAGYTSDEVLHEVATRRLLDPLDAQTEQALLKEGADPRLITALKSGQYQVPASDAARARHLQEVRDEQLAADREAGQDRLLAQARTDAQTALSRHMSNLLRGKLVIWKDGQLAPYDPNVLSSKKIFALYFGASGSEPCQKFTPQLIQFYRQFAPAHPDFEVVFISADKSAEDMQKYMEADGMPFPALAYEDRGQETELIHYAGAGIPCLVLVDGAGGVLSDSYVGKQYRGPVHVLEDLARMSGQRMVEVSGQ